jgi:hypothetical protein
MFFLFNVNKEIIKIDITSLTDFIIFTIL